MARALKPTWNFFTKAIALFLMSLGSFLWAYDPNYTLLKENKLPKELENIGIENTIGKKLDLDVPFLNEEGSPVLLSQFFQNKPVILSPVYYKCPTLCNLHLNGMMEALKSLEWTAGKEFIYVAVSINPDEKPSLASEKKTAYLKEYNRESAEKGYFLLTGSQESIQNLTNQLGFRYEYDPLSQQYIHASAAYILTPQGKVARILQGISFQPRDLRLALTEAGEGKVGTALDQFALYCFQFDPNKNKYTIYAYNLMRIGGLITVLIVGTYLGIFWRKYKMNQDQGAAT